MKPQRTIVTLLDHNVQQKLTEGEEILSRPTATLNQLQEYLISRSYYVLYSSRVWVVG